MSICSSRRLLAGLTTATTAVGSLLSAGVAVAAPVKSRFGTASAPGAVPGRYIVVLKDGTDVDRGAAAMAGRVGATVTNTYDTVLNGFAATMSAKAAKQLAADPSVAYVEADRTVSVASTQTDPVWGLDRIDQRDRPLSRTYTHGSAENVTIYVLDSGVHLSHDEFGGRASSGYDFVDRDRNAEDCNGHGTHVAAIAAGRTYGVAKDAKVVSVRVLDCDGGSHGSSIIDGIKWVTKNAVKPAVAVMSVQSEGHSAAMDEALTKSIASGVTYAVAAGNRNADACKRSPASTTTAITVAATDANDRRWSGSNYGSCVDLFAPGVRIRSAGYRGDSATATMTGTSMAAPHVAGAAALYLAQHPTATPKHVGDALATDATTDVVKNANGSPNKLLYTAGLEDVR